ncbi:MAG: hypothetical protein ACRDP6_45740 [Actinoallomurus sp.]
MSIEVKSEERPHQSSRPGPFPLRRCRELIGRNRLFTTALVLAMVLRGLTMLGYRPALWFPDSFDYLQRSLRMEPGLIHPNGYAFFLWLLRPFHSVLLVVAIQHVLGLGMATLMYALLRRYGLPSWGALLAAVVVLFDPRQLLLEQAILTETVFSCCVVSAVVLLLWRPVVTPRAACLVGALLALAALNRPVAVPLILLVLGSLVVRRAGRRVIATGLAAWLVPLVAYAGWFAAYHDRFSLSGEDGIFLWARTTSFADCTVIKPPAELVPLCPSRRHLRPWPASFLLDTKSPSHYLSDPHEWFSGSSRYPRHVPGLPARPPIDPAGDNEKAWRFAIDAILAQPLDYALTVTRDTAYTVLMADPPVQLQSFRFQPAPPFSPSPQNLDALHQYAHADARTRVAGLPAAALRYYQDRVFLSGVQFTLILTLGLGGVIRRRRRNGGPGLLPWVTAVALLVLPAATAQGDPRYGVPAMPLACLAAALAFARCSSETARCSAGSMAAADTAS